VPVYDPTRDCLRNDCIIAKLEQFAAQLSDQDLPDGQRLQALKFVVHFVGDLHQPLHVSDNDDRGGNEVHVTFNTKQTNLHAVWDTEILVPAVQGDERTYELLLVRSINSDDLPAFHGFSRTQPWLAVFNIILRAIEGYMAEHEGAHLGGRRAETGADSVARVPDH